MHDEPFTPRAKAKRAEIEAIRAEVLAEYCEGLRSFEGGEISLTERPAPEVNATRLHVSWRFMGEVYDRDYFIDEMALKMGEREKILDNVRDMIARQMVSVVKARMFSPKLRSVG